MVLCLGGDGGRTPPILPGSEELYSVELAREDCRGLQRSDRSRPRSTSKMYTSSSGGRPGQCTRNLHETRPLRSQLPPKKISSTRSCRSGANVGKVDFQANSLSKNGPIGEGLTSHERGRAGCDVRSIT